MRICSVEGCNNKHLAKGYCNKHYCQIKRNGKIKEKTKYDSNEIVIYDDYAEIVLYDNRGKEVIRALIDVEDGEKVKEYKWHLSNSGYVLTNIKGKTILLHRFIMNIWEDEFNYYKNTVDHINRNPLDNRKSNLRIVSQRENNENRDVGKKVIAIIDNKPFMIFDSTRKGARYFGISSNSNICKCCNEDGKSCGKHNGKKIVWKYLFVEEL